MTDLLEPGSSRAAGSTGRPALLTALVRVEVAWLRTLAGAGLVEDGHTAVLDDLGVEQLDAGAVEAAGNPVPALVDALRVRLGDVPDLAAHVHRGLTSQDTIDTALMLVTRDALGAVADSLDDVAVTLAGLAAEHRDTVMAGRTLTQHAVPVTFGLKAAQWLAGILDAADRVAEVRGALPVQCGGAAGTLALAGDLVAEPVRLAKSFAERLGLRWPGLPWHTRRTPITRVGDAVVEVCDALGVLAADVLLLGRPEIAEVHEVPGAGRGGSSTMPQKRNPVLAVLVKSGSLQAPHLAAQLHLCAAGSVDERPDGAWHAEWPALHRLLTLGVVMSAQAAELVASLRVDAAAMRRRATHAAGDLLAERRRPEPGDPSSYLGAAGAFVDVVLQRHRDWDQGRG